jgi:hypothetical protein
MSVESGLYTALTTNGGVAALVSLRVYPHDLPESPTFPAITYRFITVMETDDFGGITGLQNGSVEINCWSTTFDGAIALGDAVKACLAGFSGSFGGGNCSFCNWSRRAENDIQPDGTTRWRMICESELWNK